MSGVGYVTKVLSLTIDSTEYQCDHRVPSADDPRNADDDDRVPRRYRAGRRHAVSAARDRR
jgi:hypothetical protein